MNTELNLIDENNNNNILNNNNFQIEQKKLRIYI